MSTVKKKSAFILSSNTVATVASALEDHDKAWQAFQEAKYDHFMAKEILARAVLDAGWVHCLTVNPRAVRHTIEQGNRR